MGIVTFYTYFIAFTTHSSFCPRLRMLVQKERTSALQAKVNSEGLSISAVRY